MDRLKDIAVIIFIAVVYNLHSSMDRLKGGLPSRCFTCRLHLHSSMDRLKGSYRKTHNRVKLYLHSSMDRLKVLTNAKQLTKRNMIYIPVWID